MVIDRIVRRVGRVRSVTLRCGTLRCETAIEVACGTLFGTVGRETSILRTRLVLY